MPTKIYCKNCGDLCESPTDPGVLIAMDKKRPLKCRRCGAPFKYLKLQRISEKERAVLMDKWGSRGEWVPNW